MVGITRKSHSLAFAEILKEMNSHIDTGSGDVFISLKALRRTYDDFQIPNNINDAFGLVTSCPECFVFDDYSQVQDFPIDDIGLWIYAFKNLGSEPVTYFAFYQKKSGAWKIKSLHRDDERKSVGRPV